MLRHLRVRESYSSFDSKARRTVGAIGEGGVGGAQVFHHRPEDRGEINGLNDIKKISHGYTIFKPSLNGCEPHKPRV